MRLYFNSEVVKEKLEKTKIDFLNILHISFYMMFYLFLITL